MHFPKVVFNHELSAEDRGAILQELEQWMNSAGVSAVKRQIMRALLNIEKKSSADFGFKEGSDLSSFSCYVAIMNRRDLPDLLFLQYVINQIKLIRDETNELKRTVLPMALNYRRPLILPLVRQLEKFSFGLSVATIFMQKSVLLLFVAADFFYGGLRAEIGIERLLNERLDQISSQDSTVRMNDNFDADINEFVRLLDRGQLAALGFFNRILQNTGIKTSSLGDLNHHYQPEGRFR